ncbi:MAG TPA: hypothetical protein VFK96_04340 [Gammaproteobacteria bacterium]|nr:hypothetical protein [Gammaproteobacteria bacterium]
MKGNFFNRAGSAMLGIVIAAVVIFMLLPTPGAGNAAHPSAKEHEAGSMVATTQNRDCSRAYGGKPATCVQVPCSKKYRAFLGTWAGDFQSLSRKNSGKSRIFRPYHSVVSYQAKDCLENVGTGETFIVGHMTDRYPASDSQPAAVHKSLLILGNKADGTPYMRTVRDGSADDYSLVYRNQSADLSIWQMHVPSSGKSPQMTVTTIDGKDFAAGPESHKRDVTVTLTVGPPNKPYWHGVIVYGSHEKQ